MTAQALLDQVFTWFDLLVASLTPRLALECASSLLGLAGAYLVAKRHRLAGWAFVLWLASNVGWVTFGLFNDHYFLALQHVGFAITSVIGIWVWLVLPLLEDAFKRPGDQ